MSQQNDKAQLLRLVTDLLITCENTKGVDQVVPTRSCHSKMFYSSAKHTRSRFAGALNGQEICSQFSQGLQAPTVTILHSAIKNFLNNFCVTYSVLCPNARNNIWEFFVLPFFFLIIYFYCLHTHFQLEVQVTLALDTESGKH